MSVGSRIKILREIYNYNQSDLARLLFKTKNCVSAWEQDRNEIDLQTLAELSRIFKVSVDFLLNDGILEELISISNPSYLQLKLLLNLGGLPESFLHDIHTYILILNKYRS